MNNIAFEYRHAVGEEKNVAEVVFSNDQRLSLKVMHLGLRRAMPYNMFVPEQVRLPAVFCQPHLPGDPVWHEYWAVRPTRDAPTDKHDRDIHQFIVECQLAHSAGWDYQAETETEAVQAALV